MVGLSDSSQACITVSADREQTRVGVCLLRDADPDDYTVARVPDLVRKSGDAVDK